MDYNFRSCLCLTKVNFILEEETGISGNLVVKSKLAPRSGSSLKAVETHP